MSIHFNNIKLPKEQIKIFALVWVFLTVIFIGLSHFLYQVQSNKDHKEAELHGESIAASIVTELNRCVNTTDLMLDLYRFKEFQFLDNFKLICGELQADNLMIGSMYWAPNGVIKYSYPDEVDEATMHFNMLQDPIQGPKAQLAIDYHKPTIAGPHNLIEGGKGFIIRNPYFDNRGDFEAFGIMVIDTDKFLAQVMDGLSNEEKKYRFAVWKSNDPTAATDDDGYILTSNGAIADRLITMPFTAPNDQWYLSLEPLNGWNTLANMRNSILLIFCVYLIMLMSFYFLLHNHAMRLQLKQNDKEKERLAEVEKYQNELETLTIQQETQLENIRLLNEQLLNEKQKMTHAYGIIKGLSHDYHTILLVNSQTMQMQRIRTSEYTINYLDGSDLETVNYDYAITIYVKNYVAEADQERVTRAVQINDVLSQLEAHGFYSVNYMRRTDKDQLSYYQITFVAADDQRGQNQFVVAFRDIDEVLKQEQKLKQELENARREAEAANSAKTSFLFNMSHDIRTPMNAIIGYRNILEKYQDDPVKRADCLKKIADASNVLLSIIDNVLEMARIEKGTIELSETAWGVQAYCDSLYSLFADMMNRKGLTFSYSIDVEHPYVFCDPTKIREVYINILSNAYKYTNPGGSISLTLKEIPCDRDGYVTYQATIADTGIGMSEDFLPHLFEEFTREKTTTDNKIEGTGLGMSIVKRLVELMGGTIEVQSQLGVGTTFIVSLTHRMAQKSDFIVVGDVEIDPHIFEGKRILLAEDNDLNAEIAIEILSDQGFIVERAEDGVQAVEMLEAASDHHFDLVLMDIQMPRMNGYDAACAIRSLYNPVKSQIPIIAMTANAFEEDRREALKAGMNDHLAKPFNIPDLLKIVASVI